jgi:hypothetical protein
MAAVRFYGFVSCLSTWRITAETCVSRARSVFNSRRQFLGISAERAGVALTLAWDEKEAPGRVLVALPLSHGCGNPQSRTVACPVGADRVPSDRPFGTARLGAQSGRSCAGRIPRATLLS